MNQTLDLKAFFESLKANKIYYKTNGGNAGDALIGLGTYHFFQSINLSYQIFEENLDIDDETIIIYGGGGNLVKEYNHCATFIDKYYQKVKQIIILPHTINGHTELLKKVQEKVTFICRELYSYDYLKGDLKLASVYLSQDMAFYLDLNKIPYKEHQKNRLCFYPSIWKYLNKSLGLANNKWLIFKKVPKTKLFAYRVDKEKTEIAIPKNNFDVSAIFQYTNTTDVNAVTEVVADFLGFLSKSNVIFTNRLHIAIGCGLLGKEVHFKSNSYYKNKAIYEFSIKGKLNNVLWEE